MQVSDVYSDSEELETLKLSEETSIVISLFINELFWAVALETTVDCVSSFAFTPPFEDFARSKRAFIFALILEKESLPTPLNLAESRGLYSVCFDSSA